MKKKYYVEGYKRRLNHNVYEEDMAIVVDLYSRSMHGMVQFLNVKKMSIESGPIISTDIELTPCPL